MTIDTSETIENTIVKVDQTFLIFALEKKLQKKLD